MSSLLHVKRNIRHLEYTVAQIWGAGADSRLLSWAMEKTESMECETKTFSLLESGGTASEAWIRKG